MSYLAFLKAIRLFGETVMAFARTREIPSDTQIDSLRKDAEQLPKNQQDIVVAIVGSLTSLRKKAMDAGINPITMTVGFLVMLEWAIDTFSVVINMMTADKPEIRAPRVKLVDLRQTLTRIRENCKFLGGEQAYKKIALDAVLSMRNSATTDGAAGDSSDADSSDADSSDADTHRQ